MSVEIIRHELGHWITANALGFEVGEIKLQRLGKSELSASAQSFPHAFLYGKSRKILKHCEERIAVLLGGVAGEMLFENQTSERSLELLETVGKDDFQKITELLYLKASIRNIRKEDFQDYQISKIKKCWEIANKVLEERKNNINNASEKMRNIFSNKRKIVFTKREIEEFMQE
jgi:ATP-dependent Zn protease